MSEIESQEKMKIKLPTMLGMMKRKNRKMMMHSMQMTMLLSLAAMMKIVISRLLVIKRLAADMLTSLSPISMMTMNLRLAMDVFTRPREDLTKLPPFTVNSAESYVGFTVLFSNQLQCQIAQNQISWKRAFPQNVPRSLMGKEVGWKAVITAMEALKKDKYLVFIYLPKVIRNLPKEQYAIELPLAESTADAIASQQAQFTESAQDQIEMLKTKYPVGNNHLWPNICVYHDQESNNYFELTDLRISAWAAQIIKGTATYNKPQTTLAYFHSTTCIHFILSKPPTEQSMGATALSAPFIPPPAASVVPMAPGIILLNNPLGSSLI
ncbi:hypothetical protein BT96DRAFT_937385 [Gymnopus androsaceus JB14]|uniref:Uncharacterized protein n=1 Tax=Gymnopus androsaceus JB14 TaxID=1447944 RepID=A0A6A4HVM4_9AGAR|nr:hypothetical protein BT96DRAFT_937385 [Gymnopus androsaceus JB14]